MSGDVVIYKDIDDLTSSASDIVRVEVLGSRVRRINTTLPPSTQRNREIVTIHRLRIMEVFKGSEEPGAIMEVMQLGRISRRQHANYGLIDFETGEDLILFMESFNDGLPAVLLTTHQAVYRVATSDDGYIEIEGYFDFSPFTLTMEDLERIADEYFGRNP